MAGGAAAAVRPAGAAVAAAARVGVRPQGVGRNYAARAAPGRGRTALAASAAAWRQLPPSAPTSRALSAGAAEEAKQPIEVTIEKVAKPDPQKVCSALLLRVDEREGGRVCVCMCASSLSGRAPCASGTRAALLLHWRRVSAAVYFARRQRCALRMHTGRWTARRRREEKPRGPLPAQRPRGCAHACARCGRFL